VLRCLTRHCRERAITSIEVASSDTEEREVALSVLEKLLLPSKTITSANTLKSNAVEQFLRSSRINSMYHYSVATSAPGRTQSM
jgi:hypothetical protein